MVDPYKKARFCQLGSEIKELMPDVNGSVTFHLNAQGKEPKVEVRLCDVTRKEGK